MAKIFREAKNLALRTAETVKRHIFLLSYMLWMVLLSLAALAGINAYAKMAILIVLCFAFLTILLLYMDGKKKAPPFPESPKRLTYKDRDGSIRISREDWEEAAIYLYEVEEYIKRSRYMM